MGIAVCGNIQASGLMKQHPVTFSSCPLVLITSLNHTQDKMREISPSQTLYHLYPPTNSLLSLFALNTFLPPRSSSCWKAHTKPISLLGRGASEFEVLPTHFKLFWVRQDIVNVLPGLFPFDSIWRILKCNSHNTILRSWAPGPVLWGLLVVSSQCFRPRPLEWLFQYHKLSCSSYSTPTRSTHPLNLIPFHAVRIQTAFRQSASCMTSDPLLNFYMPEVVIYY